MIYSNQYLCCIDGDRVEGLNLSESDVEVTYTRYVNNYKKFAQSNGRTIDEAVEAELTPGKKI